MEKILVVDDEPDCQITLQLYLETHGYQVRCASSGPEALELFELDPPDLIVSDVFMPVMDGFELCRQLRANRAGTLVPFIFLSGQGELDKKVEGHAVGADDYLVKPFQPAEILAKIRGQLERLQRMRSEMERLLQQSLPHPTDSTTEGPESLPLTPAELKVFWEAVQGYTNKQISEHLFLSPRTVQAHLSNIFSKLQLKNRTQLAHFVAERGYKVPAENSSKARGETEKAKKGQRGIQIKLFYW